MDCKRAYLIVSQCLLAAAALVACDSRELRAKPMQGWVYNPVTQQMEPNVRTRRLATWTPADRTQPNAKAVNKAVRQAPVESDSTGEKFDSLVEQAAYESEEYYETCPVQSSCDDVCAGCCDMACGDCVGYPTGQNFYVGFETAFVKPRFENNEAFTVMESDGALFESFNAVEFDYDLELTPRVFIGWQRCDGLGLRVTWWQFDHSAANSSANPPANGFGEIAAPPFGDVEISSNIPTDTFSAASDLDAYAIDVEATKQTSFASWNFGVGGGVRYAATEQRYFAQLRDSGADLRDQIDFRQSLEGIGPTISIEAHRPWSRQLSSFCKARGSVLFGDGESRLNAGEDLDLANSFTTTRVTNRDDLLSIAEIQVGLRWQASQNRGRRLIPFVTSAFEGQIWNGAGNASSEEGNLGFFGFTAGAGVNW